MRSHPNDHPQIAFADPACLEAVDGQGLGLRSRVLLPSPARAGNAALGDHRYILCLTIPSKTPADRVFARTVAGPNHTVILGVVDNPFNHRREVLFLI